MRTQHRDSLITLILGYDEQIQCYVEEDYPKTPGELQKLTITELRDWSDRRLAELLFLTQNEISIDEIDQLTRS